MTPKQRYDWCWGPGRLALQARGYEEKAARRMIGKWMRIHEQLPTYEVLFTFSNIPAEQELGDIVEYIGGMFRKHKADAERRAEQRMGVYIPNDRDECIARYRKRKIRNHVTDMRILAQALDERWGIDAEREL